MKTFLMLVSESLHQVWLTVILQLFVFSDVDPLLKKKIWSTEIFVVLFFYWEHLSGNPSQILICWSFLPPPTQTESLSELPSPFRWRNSASVWQAAGFHVCCCCNFYPRVICPHLHSSHCPASGCMSCVCVCVCVRMRASRLFHYFYVVTKFGF